MSGHYVNAGLNYQNTPPEGISANGLYGQAFQTDASLQLTGGSPDVFNVVNSNEFPAPGDGVAWLAQTKYSGVYPVGQANTYSFNAEGTNYAVSLENADVAGPGYFVNFKPECLDGQRVFNRVTYATHPSAVIGVSTNNYGFLANAHQLPISQGVEHDTLGYPVINNGSTVTSEEQRLATNTLSHPYQPAEGRIGVALVGVVRVYDDGLCQPGTMCDAGTYCSGGITRSGIAIHNGKRFIVMRRVAPDVIEILLTPTIIY